MLSPPIAPTSTPAAPLLLMMIWPEMEPVGFGFASCALPIVEIHKSTTKLNTGRIERAWPVMESSNFRSRFTRWGLRIMSPTHVTAQEFLAETHYRVLLG